MAKSETKTVVRMKNGQKYELTPTQNFIKDAGYRVDIIIDQLNRLSKQHGANFEYTDEMLNAIQDTILDKLTSAIDNLKKPGQAKKTAGFAAVLSKC